MKQIPGYRRVAICLFFSGLLLGRAYPQTGRTTDPDIHIIPEPVSLVTRAGHFIPGKNTVILFDPAASAEAAMLAHVFSTQLGYRLRMAGSATQGLRGSSLIRLHINKKTDAVSGTEGYTMTVNSNGMTISANQPAGLFYGIQTLMQLLPPAVAGSTGPAAKTAIPCLDITDYPRFGYRGLMLDVSRHFFPKEFVKKYIREMARYKFNTFHWHLTDDNGWRIEIKGLPALTETGAWRVARTGVWRLFQPPQPGEPTPYGGYYTQDEIREIVAYAKERFISIIPEIDVPAHSLSLIAAYPALSCTRLQYAVNPGSPFYKKDDNVLCVNNDSTWLILDKIFTQVADLFPGPYIHIGGDEAYKGFWEKCPRDQALMKKESLANTEELQSFFIRKLEKLIVSKGKKMIGWDEILEGGLAPEATVMSWRGTKGGIEAAAMGHPVIMTPINSVYLSRKQSAAVVEPYAPGMVRLKTCYQFEPVPDGVDPKYVLGAEACLWTEFIPTARHAEYMVWPRALAVSELLWSPKTSRHWPGFVRRAEQQFKYLDADTVKYARAIYDPEVSAVKGSDDSLTLMLSTEMPGLDLYYSFDGTVPDPYYPEFSGIPLNIPRGASSIQVVSYRKGERIGEMVRYSLADLKASLEPGKTVE